MPESCPSTSKTTVIGFIDKYNATDKYEIDAADHIVLHHKVTDCNGVVKERTIEMPIDQFVKNYEHEEICHEIYGEIREVARKTRKEYAKIDFSKTLRARLFK